MSTQPVYVYDPVTDAVRTARRGVDLWCWPSATCPCELSREASDGVQSRALTLVPALAAADFSLPFPRLRLLGELLRAYLHHGELTPDYEYLRRFVDVAPSTDDAAQSAGESR